MGILLVLLLAPFNLLTFLMAFFVFIATTHGVWTQSFLTHIWGLQVLSASGTWWSHCWAMADGSWARWQIDLHWNLCLQVSPLSLLPFQLLCLWKWGRRVMWYGNPHWLRGRRKQATTFSFKIILFSNTIALFQNIFKNAWTRAVSNILWFWCSLFLSAPVHAFLKMFLRRTLCLRRMLAQDALEFSSHSGFSL